MKQLRLILVTSFLGLVAVAANLYAQGGVAPSSQLGIGLNTSGATVQYAATPSLQFGLEAGFYSTTQSGTTVSGYEIGPYARFLLEGTVNPFIQVGFRAIKAGGVSTSDIYAGVGLEYFISRNVGIYAEASVLTLALSDPSSTTIALAGDRAGLEWYFNR